MIESPYEKPAIMPPKGHPRLFLTEKDLPRIRENLRRPENSLAAEVYEELLSFPIEGKSPTPEYGSYSLGEALAAEALAFRALLSGTREDAEAAISAVNFLLDGFTVSGGNMGARWGGHLILAASEVYDWCYGFIPEETRYKMIADCERIASAYMEMGYPPSRQTAVSGHGTEAQLLRDLMSLAVAAYDERPDIYGFCAGRIFTEYVPSIAELLGEGTHNQGPTYGSYRLISLCWCELLFRSMSGKSVFGSFESVFEWLLYVTRPDGQSIRLGDDFNETKADYNIDAPFTVPFFFAYALTGRDDFLSEFRRGFERRFLLPDHLGMDFYAESSWGEGLFSPVAMLLFDRITPEKKAGKLPSARYFGTPVGETIFKKDDTSVLLKIGEYWGGNHDHLDTGCFQFYCGAPLLTDSGVYDSYGSAHRRQYLTHSAAHNCLTVERTDKNVFGEWKDDIRYTGGVRRPDGGREPATVSVLKSEEYHMAEILSHSESEDGCAITGDLSRAYSHSCKKVVRSMKYDHPSRTLTVRDDVESLDPSFRKTFHMHVQEEPVIDGSTVIIRNKGYEAVVRVIAPGDAVITKVGGPGHEFEADGVNFEPRGYYKAEAGWGEIRVSPQHPSAEDTFIVEITAAGKKE